MAKKPSKELEALAEKALKVKMKADDLADEYKKLSEETYEQMKKEGLLSTDTHAIGNVRTVISPNRFFDEQKAREKFGTTSAVIRKAIVRKVDGKILKQLVTPGEYEECMSSHPKEFKLGFKVND